MSFKTNIQNVIVYGQTVPAAPNIRIGVQDKHSDQFIDWGFFAPDIKQPDFSGKPTWLGQNGSFHNIDAILAELTQLFTQHQADNPALAARELYDFCIEYNLRRLSNIRFHNNRTSKTAIMEFELQYLATHYGKTYDELYDFIVKNAHHGLVLSLGGASTHEPDIDKLTMRIAEHSGLNLGDLMVFLARK